MNGDEEATPDMGQMGQDMGNAGPQNPSNYRDPMINQGNPQVTRDVNESEKRHEPTPKGKEDHSPARKAALARGKERTKSVTAKAHKHSAKK